MYESYRHYFYVAVMVESWFVIPTPGSGHDGQSQILAGVRSSVDRSSLLDKLTLDQIIRANGGIAPENFTEAQ